MSRVWQNQKGSQKRWQRMFGIAAIALSGLAFGLLSADPAYAQRDSQVQSNARPLGFDIVDTVKRARSDRDSRRFHRDTYGTIYDNLGLGPTDTNWSGIADVRSLDVGDIVLNEEYDVRVYFVNEDAGFQNTLGFFSRPATQPDNDFSNINPQLIFPNVSSSVDFWDGRQRGQLTLDQNTPLAPGDFVNLGTTAAGTNLDFFLLPDGQTPAIFTEDTLNPGGFQQFAAFALVDSPFLVLKVEDQYFGGDDDFNDAVFALDVGVENLRGLIAASAPLPAPILALMLPLFFVLRRQLQRRWGGATKRQEHGA